MLKTTTRETEYGFGNRAVSGLVTSILPRGGLMAILAFLTLYPMLMVIYGSFKGGPPGSVTPFTIQGYAEAFSSSSTYNAIWNTLWLGILRLSIALAVGLFLAWVICRTDTPWSNTLEILIWLQIFLPLLPRTVAWILLLEGNTGLINVGIERVFGFHSPFDIRSYPGILWVSLFPFSTLMFIYITPAFRSMDNALEEASRMSGASGLSTFFRVTIPALAPAILGAMALTFISLLESFEPELFLIYGKGIYVYTTRVWWLLSITPADYPQAMALSTLFLAVVLILVILQWKLLGNKQFTTVTGKGYAPRRIKLGRWKYITLGLVIAFFVIGTLLPLLTLILGSFMKLWGVFTSEPFTTANWERTLHYGPLLLAIRNTLLLGVGTATLGVAMYSLVSYIIIKTRFSERRVLDLITWLPWGVPGMVMALGFLWAFVGGASFLIVIRGTVWLMVIAFLARGLPIGTRIMQGSVIQLSSELEECSRTSGASWTYTFRKIMVPLLRPAFVSTWVMIFLLAVRDLATVVFLYTPKSRVLSIIMMEHWSAGEYERSIVVGLILTIILMSMAVLAKCLGVKKDLGV